jgi:hypothetical protein
MLALLPVPFFPRSLNLPYPLIVLGLPGLTVERVPQYLSGEQVLTGEVPTYDLVDTRGLPCHVVCGVDSLRWEATTFGLRLTLLNDMVNFVPRTSSYRILRRIKARIRLNPSKLFRESLPSSFKLDILLWFRGGRLGIRR